MNRKCSSLYKRSKRFLRCIVLTGCGDWLFLCLLFSTSVLFYMHIPTLGVLTLHTNWKMIRYVTCANLYYTAKLIPHSHASGVCSLLARIPRRLPSVVNAIKKLQFPWCLAASAEPHCCAIMLGLHVVSRAATTYYKSLYSVVFLFSPLTAIKWL